MCACLWARYEQTGCFGQHSADGARKRTRKRTRGGCAVIVAGPRAPARVVGADAAALRCSALL